MWSQDYYPQHCLQMHDKEMNQQSCEKLGLCICSQACIKNEAQQADINNSVNPQIMKLEPEYYKELSESQFSKHDEHKIVLPSSSKKKIKKVDYFSKNFLPSFKMPHLYYLRKKLGATFVDSFPLFKRLTRKNGITLRDYEQLYKIQQFRQALTNMIDQKILYRDLMTSRSKPGYKITHNQILFNFEKVLATHKFERIAQHKSISVPQTWIR